MRRFFTLFLGFTAFVTSSCEDKSTEVTTDTIALSRSSVAFAVEGGTATISVASLSQWEASCPDSWVILNREKDFLKVSTDNNETGDLRNTTIIIRSANDQHTIEVHQAYSRSGVSISLSGGQKLDFDSEGDSGTFSVTSNSQWTATSKDGWITIARNDNNSTVTLSAAQNTGEHRTGLVTVTATDGTISESREVIITQISRKENDYFNILGTYALFAENWYFGGKSLGVSGVATYCTIEPDEYTKTSKSVNIKGLFLSGTIVKGNYDSQKGTLSIEAGSLALTQKLPTTTRYIYMTQVNMDTGRFLGGLITATLGKGKDDQGVERKALLLSGLNPAYRALGLTAREGNTYKSYNDIYYASGTMYLVESTKAAPTEALVRAAKDVPPASDDNLVSNN